MNEPAKWTIKITTDEDGAQKFLTALQELLLAYPPLQVDNDSLTSEPSYPSFKDGEDPF